MKYLVLKKDELLIATRYEGNFDTYPKDNIAYFSNFASRVGCSKLMLCGESISVKPASSAIEMPNEPLTVIPGVYIKGSIIASKLLQTPFINDSVLGDLLTTLDWAPGLLIPKFLKPYISQTDDVGTEFEAPACIYKNNIVSTFPANLPSNYATDNILMTWYRGVKCLYCTDSCDSKIILDYCHSVHLSHFVSNLDFYPELSALPHVNMDDQRTVFYLLDEMKEIEPGVYECTDMLKGNWAGSIVDTVRHQIR